MRPSQSEPHSSRVVFEALKRCSRLFRRICVYFHKYEKCELLVGCRAVSVAMYGGGGRRVKRERQRTRMVCVCVLREQDEKDKTDAPRRQPKTAKKLPAGHTKLIMRTTKKHAAERGRLLHISFRYPPYRCSPSPRVARVFRTYLRGTLRVQEARVEGRWQFGPWVR